MADRSEDAKRSASSGIYRSLEGASKAQTAFMLAARVGHLATANAAGQPHVVPVCFAVSDGRLYSPLDEKPKRVSADQLRRVKDIRENQAVCLVVDRFSEDWQRLAWLQVRARAELVQPGREEHNRAVGALRERYRQYESMALEERPLIRLTPLRILSWRV